MAEKKKQEEKKELSRIEKRSLKKAEAEKLQEKEKAEYQKSLKEAAKHVEQIHEHVDAISALLRSISKAFKGREPRYVRIASKQVSSFKDVVTKLERVGK